MIRVVKIMNIFKYIGKYIIELLLSVIAICYFGMQFYAEQCIVWKQETGDAFKETLRKEIDNRFENDAINFRTLGKPRLSTLPGFRDTIAIISSRGLKKFPIPEYKKQHALINDEASNIAITAIFRDTHSLNIDTLNRKWMQLLVASGKHPVTAVRLATTNWDDMVSFDSTAHFPVAADSLRSYYMGGRLEMEITGFAVVPVWWRLFSFTNWLLLCLPIAVIVLVSWLLRMVLPRFVEKWKKAHKEVEFIPAVSVKGSERKPIYRLSASILFDAEHRTLQSGEQTVSLRPQEAAILETLLLAENYHMDVDEFYFLVWNEKYTNLPRINTAANRLRGKLIQIAPFELSVTQHDVSLKIPDSIEGIH